jgi:BirA family transcriptional regulator, biotin operon repressor / biotin---[acetyl-CoA-carboxylase] ligase
MNKSDKNIDCVIFDKLKEAKDYVSGESMAVGLGISRQGLWKHIKNFSDKGYKITALQHSGYKLVSSPDKLYPWEIKHKLKTKLIGKNIHYHDSVASTQSLLWALGLEGACEGAVVLAETQKKGKGRMQRQWVSPRGGIYFSLLLKPNFFSVKEAPQIALMIGLACVKALKQITEIEAKLKWPNDIYVNGNKFGGILCEINAEIDRINFIVVGVGLNINTRDLPPGATSLFRVTKNKFSRVEILQSLFIEIEKLYSQVKREGFEDIRSQWQQHCMLWGKRIKVKVFDRTTEGEAMGLDEEGYLRLRLDNGFIERISSGDIVKVNLNKGLS